MAKEKEQKVPFGKLELKALWLLATHGSRRQPLEILMDPELAAAGERAIAKVWKAEKGMAHSWPPRPKSPP